MTLYLLCTTEEVADNEPKKFIVKENEILVIKQKGEFFCLEARCTHAGAPLAEGVLDDRILQCPWHGSRFNIETGEVVRGPAKKQLRTYYVTVKDNNVYVDL